MDSNFSRIVEYVDVTDHETGSKYRVNKKCGSFGNNRVKCTFIIGDGPYDLNKTSKCQGCSGLMMNISVVSGKPYCSHSCYLSLRNLESWKDPEYQREKSEIFKRVISDTRNNSRAMVFAYISKLKEQGVKDCYLYVGNSNAEGKFKLGISINPEKRSRWKDEIPNLTPIAIGNVETICALEWYLKDKFIGPGTCSGESLNTELYPEENREEIINTVYDVCDTNKLLLSLIASREKYEHTSDRYAGFTRKLTDMLKKSGIKIRALEA